MMKRSWMFGVVGLAPISLLMVMAFSGALAGTDASGNTDQEKACWGQASAVFARAGEMGIHARGQEEPRHGLRNLAVLLFNDGVIEEPTLEALGAFVADEWGLSIDACME